MIKPKFFNELEIAINMNGNIYIIANCDRFCLGSRIFTIEITNLYLAHRFDLLLCKDISTYLSIPLTKIK